MLLLCELCPPVIPNTSAAVALRIANQPFSAASHQSPASSRATASAYIARASSISVFQHFNTPTLRLRKNLPQPRLAVIKNFPQFPRHEKPIYQPSARHTIGHHISRHRAAGNFLKLVTMNPAAVRPASLRISKTQRRLPINNFASPPHRHSMQPYPVANYPPFPHHHRQRRKNGEMQPRRGKPVQIFGAGKEIENLRPRVRQRQTTMQLKIRHTINRTTKTRSSPIRYG